MREALLFFIGLLIVYVYGSTFLFWYWAFKSKQGITRGDSNKNYYVFIGSLIGIGIFFYAGFDKALFFIPLSWGGINEDGDFVSTRSYFAGILAFAATAFIHSRPYQIIKFFKSKEE